MSMSYAEFLKYTLQRGPTWKGGVSFQKWFRASMLWRRSAIAAWMLNSSAFAAPLTHTAVPIKAAAGTGVSFTRATTKTWQNNDGYLVTGLSGEIGFPGARRVRNLVAGSSEDLSNAQWAIANASGFASKSGNVITFASGTTSNDRVFQTEPVVAGNTNAVSFTLSGTGSVEIGVMDGSGSVGPVAGLTVALTATPTRYSCAGVVLNTGANGGLQIRSLGTAAAVTFHNAQLEDVTAQTTQTAGEYVSVGVESAPYYHGSFVDGVKCFPTDLSGNPLPTQVTYDAVSLNGVAGTYVSTPDSVAASITGDIDIRVKAALTDWTPSVENWLVGKIAGAGVRSYDMYIAATTGRLVLRASVDGTVIPQWTSTVSPSVSDGGAIWVRGCRVASTGSVTFYTSADGDAWTQLGDVVAGTSGAIFDSTSVLTIGSNIGGVSPTNGKIYRVQIYNGIDGTLAVDFDASRYAGGTTLTGSTGETWTLQGNAVIHPTNSPMLGYLAEGAATNLCLQSQTIATAPWQIGNGIAVTADQYVAPDGTTTMDKLTALAGNTQHFWYQQVTTTAAVQTYSVYLRYVNNQWARIGVYDGVASYYAAFDILNGVVGSTVGAVTATTIEPVGDGVTWRVSLTGTFAASALSQIYLSVVNADDPSFYLWNAAGTEAIGAWGAQLELGSFASSYIATTTAAVARNADVLTYSSAGNILGTAGWAYAELSTYWTTVQAGGSQALGTGTVSVGPFLNSATSLSTGVRIFDGTNVADATLTLDMYRTPRKRAARWGSDIAVCADGGAVVTGTFDGSMGSVLYIGCAGDTTQQWNGTIRNVRIGQRALSSSELQAITS